MRQPFVRAEKSNLANSKLRFQHSGKIDAAARKPDVDHGIFLRNHSSSQAPTAAFGSGTLRFAIAGLASDGHMQVPKILRDSLKVFFRRCGIERLIRRRLYPPLSVMGSSMFQWSSVAMTQSRKSEVLNKICCLAVIDVRLSHLLNE